MHTKWLNHQYISHKSDGEVLLLIWVEGCPHGVVANVLDSTIQVSKFKLQ